MFYKIIWRSLFCMIKPRMPMAITSENIYILTKRRIQEYRKVYIYLKAYGIENELNSKKEKCFKRNHSC